MLSQLSTNERDERDVYDKIHVLVAQEHGRSKNIQTFCRCPIYETISTLFGPDAIMAGKPESTKLLAMSKLVLKQSEDVYLDRMKQLLDTPNGHFTFDKDGLLMRQDHRTG